MNETEQSNNKSASDTQVLITVLSIVTTTVIAAMTIVDPFLATVNIGTMAMPAVTFVPLGILCLRVLVEIGKLVMNYIDTRNGKDNDEDKAKRAQYRSNIRSYLVNIVILVGLVAAIASIPWLAQAFMVLFFVNVGLRTGYHVLKVGFYITMINKQNMNHKISYFSIFIAVFHGALQALLNQQPKQPYILGLEELKNKCLLEPQNENAHIKEFSEISLIEILKTLYTKTNERIIMKVPEPIFNVIYEASARILKSSGKKPLQHVLQHLFRGIIHGFAVQFDTSFSMSIPYSFLAALGCELFMSGNDLSDAMQNRFERAMRLRKRFPDTFEKNYNMPATWQGYALKMLVEDMKKEQSDEEETLLLQEAPTSDVKDQVEVLIQKLSGIQDVSLDDGLFSQAEQLETIAGEIVTQLSRLPWKKAAEAHRKLSKFCENLERKELIEEVDKSLGSKFDAIEVKRQKLPQRLNLLKQSSDPKYLFEVKGIQRKDITNKHRERALEKFYGSSKGGYGKFVLQYTQQSDISGAKEQRDSARNSRNSRHSASGTSLRETSNSASARAHVALDRSPSQSAKEQRDSARNSRNSRHSASDTALRENSNSASARVHVVLASSPSQREFPNDFSQFTTLPTTRSDLKRSSSVKKDKDPSVKPQLLRRSNTTP